MFRRLLPLLPAVFPLFPAFGADSRRHPGAELAVILPPAGASNGCRLALALRGTVTCGRPPHVSEVRWKYLSSTFDGDLYLFVRRFPVDEPSMTKESRVIEYKGKPLTLWEDAFQKMVVRPRERSDPENATASATR